MCFNRYRCLKGETIMTKKNILLTSGLALAVSATALSCVLLTKNAKFLSAKGEVSYWTIEFGADNILDTDHATDGAEIDEYYWIQQHLPL